MTQKRPNHLHLVEGNPGHKAQGDLATLELPPVAPEEPDWSAWFPLFDPDEDAYNAAAQLAVRSKLDGEDDPVARLDAEVEMRKEANLRMRAWASEEWNRIVPILDGHGLLTQMDRMVLIEYCTTWASLQECNRQVAIEGITLNGSRGVIRHPAATEANSLRGAMKFYINQLGLAPVARDALAPVKRDDEDDSPFD